MLTPWLCCLMLFMMTDGVISRAAVSDILVDADRTDVRCDPATDENLCDDGRSDTLDVCTPSTNACAHIEFEFKVDYLVANRIQPTSSAEFSEGSDAANNGARNVGDPCTFPRPCYPGETTQTDFYSKFFPDCQGFAPRGTPCGFNALCGKSACDGRGECASEPVCIQPKADVKTGIAIIGALLGFSVLLILTIGCVVLTFLRDGTIDGD